MNALIGLLGKKRSGKDTVAHTLTEERGFKRFAFADPMKTALLRLDPAVGYDGQTRRLFDVVKIVGWEDAKECQEVRRLLQEFGGAIRQLDPDFWVRTTMVPASFARLRQPVVITDVRFANEAEAIKREGGVLIRVVRPDVISSDAHESENALNDFYTDATIVNDGTLDALAAQVRALAL